MKLSELAMSLLLVVIVVGGLVYIVLDSEYYIKAKENSCGILNMEYHYVAGGAYCIDNNNKAHLTIIECEGELWKQTCKARLIEVE